MFATLLQERAPPGIQIIPEFVLTTEPQRADLLLIRRTDTSRCDEQAQVLRGLWPLLSTNTLIEFKSAARPARRGDWAKLLSYGLQYHTHLKRFSTLARSDLTLVLVVPALTPTLRTEADHMSWKLLDRTGGYWQVHGMTYPSYVVELDVVKDTERDDLLSVFGHGKLEKTSSFRWWSAHFMGSKEDKPMIRDLEGFDEAIHQFLQSLPIELRLAGLPPEVLAARLQPEERLAGLPAEERLAGLSPDESILALPNEVLKRLPSEFIATLPRDVQATICERIRH